MDFTSTISYLRIACRHCYQLAYESQREAAHDRALRRTQAIRMKLGGSGSLAEDFPERPKGMHWRTYSSLYQKAQEAESYSWQTVAVSSSKSLLAHALPAVIFDHNLDLEQTMNTSRLSIACATMLAAGMIALCDDAMGDANRPRMSRPRNLRSGHNFSNNSSNRFPKILIHYRGRRFRLPSTANNAMAQTWGKLSATGEMSPDFVPRLSRQRNANIIAWQFADSFQEPRSREPPASVTGSTRTTRTQHNNKVPPALPLCLPHVLPILTPCLESRSIPLLLRTQAATPRVLLCRLY